MKIILTTTNKEKTEAFRATLEKLSIEYSEIKLVSLSIFFILFSKHTSILNYSIIININIFLSHMNHKSQFIKHLSCFFKIFLT